MYGHAVAPLTPFQIAVGDAHLADPPHRLARPPWPEREAGEDWSQGIPLAYVQEVCEYWRTAYDWRAREAHLNQFPQFRIPLSGGGDETLGFHFIHARSPEASALPLVITHGWPGSTVEFMKVI